MKAKIYLAIESALVIASFAMLQACYAETTYPYTYGNGYAYGGYGYSGDYSNSGYRSYNKLAHEEREYSSEPHRTVCNSFGTNCMTCDADGDYCRRSIF